MTSITIMQVNTSSSASNNQQHNRHNPHQPPSTHYTSDHATPAAKFFPLILFHSKNKLVTKPRQLVTTPITNTSLTAELYASNTNGSCCAETRFRIPVAPAATTFEASMEGMRS